MRETKISIIIPVHNTEKNLSGCLDSVVGQTHQNLEIILVDNGSTDNSGVICDQYAAKDGRIKVIHKEEGGVSSARNAGLAAAAGEYIGWVDSDDWVEPDMFEYLLQNALQYGADITVCGWHEHHDGWSEVRNRESLVQLNTGQALWALLDDRGMIRNYLWNKLCRSGLFEKIHFPDGRRYEDIATVYRLFMRGQMVICLPEAKYHYQRYPGSLVDDKSLGAELDYFFAAKERFEVLSPAWPQYGALMMGQAINAAVKLWCIYFDNPRSERLKDAERMKQVSQFARAYGGEALRHMELGLSGRILVRLTSYASTWSFVLARCIDKLYLIKRGREGMK